MKWRFSPLLWSVFVLLSAGEHENTLSSQLYGRTRAWIYLRCSVDKNQYISLALRDSHLSISLSDFQLFFGNVILGNNVNLKKYQSVWSGPRFVVDNKWGMVRVRLHGFVMVHKSNMIFFNLMIKYFYAMMCR